MRGSPESAQSWWPHGLLLRELPKLLTTRGDRFERGNGELSLPELAARCDFLDMIGSTAGEGAR
jgi:hypothetical protein